MTESMQEWALDRIGISEPPYDLDDVSEWPTYGYDGYATGEYDDHDGKWAWRPDHSRKDWLWLCDEMLSRWQAFRQAILDADPKHFCRAPSPEEPPK